MDVRVGFQIAPAQCFTCGNGDSSLVVVDTGEHPLAIKRFRIYICDGCVTAMAKKVAEYKGEAWVSPQEAEKLMGAAGESVMWQDRAEVAEGKLSELAEFAKGLT